MPPSPPEAFFGRDSVIEQIVRLAENLNPVALTGPGGIGKTSIALTALHHNRIKARFGDARWFIRCDQFPASRANFLGQLSKTIGAGVENPDDLSLLRPFLSSKEKILIVLDHVESILDPRGIDAKGIYNVVEELGRLKNISLVITSCITTVPPNFRCLRVPTLSMAAAHSIIRHIHCSNERPRPIIGIILELDSHPLSVTLLAKVASRNQWNDDRLFKESKEYLLRKEDHNGLAAAIEFSLASPMFKGFGPNTRELLEVIAFYPQGVKEENLDWLFPTVSTNVILDELCIHSLTYRSDGYVTMLSSLRDYFRPQDPKSSPLLCATKESYFTRLSVNVDSGEPGSGDTRWIVSEDMNVEHLLDVFTSIDSNSYDVWEASANFMRHLYLHGPRQTVLGSKIEQLPDDHPSKPVCLIRLSQLFQQVGNFAEQKRVLTHALELSRQRGDDGLVADALYNLSAANWTLCLSEEGIQQAQEASEIYGRLGHTTQQKKIWISLAHLLFQDKQLDAVEAVLLPIVGDMPEKVTLAPHARNGQGLLACNSCQILGSVYREKHEAEKAIHYYSKGLRIASTFSWPEQSFLIHYELARLFYDEDKFDEAYAHLKQAKGYAADVPYLLDHTKEMDEQKWHRQLMSRDALPEASRLLEVYGKVRAANRMGVASDLLQHIEEVRDT